MILFPGLARCLQVLSLAFGIVLLPSVTEAGLFDKMRARKEARKEPPTVTKPTPRPQHRSSYRDAHGDAYINHELLAAGKDAEKKVVIDISRQRAFLIIHDLVAIDTAVSTARRGKYTPRGSYPITEKVASGKVSTLYHVYMPYWMRLGQSTVGMHVGDLPGYPASAGCIRLPQRIAPLLFENLTLGVPVEVVDSWDEEGLRIPYTVRKPTLFADT
ncbi:MAG: L,D-transpeptidase [Verrucomicrobiales bacterium]|nr:L,D-transpeptidase [Verrucomicrobiales bacterium]